MYTLRMEVAALFHSSDLSGCATHLHIFNYTRGLCLIKNGSKDSIAFHLLLASIDLKTLASLHIAE